MDKPPIVIDTSVWIAALRSRQGAAFKLISLIGSPKFSIHISVPLILEYEDAAHRRSGETKLSAREIADLLDYVCAVAEHHAIFYLWRPFLSDPKDDMVLELAVAAQCHYIVTYNSSDFQGAEQFGIKIVTPKEFLQKIGELK
jgi:putative PIN family toxin of toxin-antitoxin system